MNKIVKLILIFLVPATLYSHSLLLNVFDNNDGTITVEGMFNTGESAAGAFVKLQALNSGEILFEKRLPDSNELTIKIPKIKYQVLLDGGPGHTVIKEGIPPKEGFIKEEKKVKKNNNSKRMNATISSSKAVTISIAIAFILLFATIFISIRNTNKLIKELQTKSR
ncbi:hypothetical protein CRV01_04040 [Arcobacter sp. CECT 8983]|uniref:hypothetical protein n=1 Tax=Arcobacter sp. CECT 8983 TaxID=2044508 RepID=UPI00100AE739|nr:hypothetical protein [Arcobacter sp. CECT 8983]RXJ90335.1 hypothetical protein CRV01_04040 [Arcobacter sp. CECT 8983]